MSEPKYFLRTLGCKANFADGQSIEAELQRRGWKPAFARGDKGVRLCIVNSCTVTDEADRQSRKLAARLARENPEARVVVTGCAAEVEPERLQASAGIHYVVGNQDKPRLVDLVLQALEKERPTLGERLGSVESYPEMRSRHPMDREWPTPEQSLSAPLEALSGDTARTRVFLRIQEGCNAFCTYCVIPYGRGPTRSLRLEALVEQVQGLVKQGTREVILTGTNIGDYGLDWSDTPQFDELVEKLLQETQVERLRLGSLDPVEITPRLLNLMAQEQRLCAHFHVSLQSAHSKILRLMKRKYSGEQAAACLHEIAKRVPHAFVGMDVITGFPGETKQDFEESYARLEALPWSRLHVFPYSERAGTPATRLPGSVPKQERAERADRLRELSDRRLKQVYEAALAQGGASDVLLEGHGQDGLEGQKGWTGHSLNYLRFWVPASPVGRNEVVRVRPQGLSFDPVARDYWIKGEIY